MKYYFTDMTIGELRKALNGLPDNMPVVGVGHFGEALCCDDARVKKVYASIGKPGEDMFTIDIEDAGEEPE